MTAIDITEDEFSTAVLDRSHDVPVVVDFWAPWCGPCRVLGPILERVAESRPEVDLVKLNVDEAPTVASHYQVQGIPAVKAFRNGRVVAEFVGAVGPKVVEELFDRLAPTEADRLVAAAAAADEAEPVSLLEQALAAEPRHLGARLALARHQLDAGDPAAAVATLGPVTEHEAARRLTEEAQLVAAAGGADLEALERAVTDAPNDARAHLDFGVALAAAGRYDEALDHLMVAVEAGGDLREEARRQMVSIFDIMGQDPRVAPYQRRLAAALY